MRVRVHVSKTCKVAPEAKLSNMGTSTWEDWSFTPVIGYSDRLTVNIKPWKLKGFSTLDSSALLGWTLLLTLAYAVRPITQLNQRWMCCRPASSQVWEKELNSGLIDSITTSQVGVNKDVISLMPADRERERQTSSLSCHVGSRRSSPPPSLDTRIQQNFFPAIWTTRDF